MNQAERRVALVKNEGDLAAAIRAALTEAGLLSRISRQTRVALKPNLTYPFHKPGVTTTPEFVRAAVRVLRDYTDHLAVVESDGGYGAWDAEEALQGHGLYELEKEFGIKVVNLCDGPSEQLTFHSGRRIRTVPLPVRLTKETDLLLSLPVPKIHCMTGVSLAYKNQWGCVPDRMRLRRHYVFDDAIVAINQALRPAVLADGTWFLDRNGPLWGAPLRMDLVVAATDAGAADLYLCELMSFPWRKSPHLRRAVKLGDMPARLDAIRFNVDPRTARTHVFSLRRTPRNWIAWAAFKSRFLTWLGYESWLGRVVLHGILYAMVGKPVPERAQQGPRPHDPDPGT
jgi:uncharacterized protein (DUF362 family)